MTQRPLLGAFLNPPALPVVLNLRGGDSLTLDYSTGTLNGAVNLTGGGISTLHVRGQGLHDAFTMAPGRLVHNGITSTWTGVAGIELNGCECTVAADLNDTSLRVSNASVTFTTTQHLNQLYIIGSVAVAPGGDHTLTIDALDIEGDYSGLDLADNELLINGGSVDPISRIRLYLLAGFRARGTPEGSYIESTLADSGHCLGYADGADGVVSGLAAGTILVKYTWRGDANLDGSVNLADLLILTRHFGQADPAWDAGNFNYYDPTVNLYDFLTLTRNFGQGPPAPAASSGAADSSILRPPRRRVSH